MTSRTKIFTYLKMMYYVALSFGNQIIAIIQLRLNEVNDRKTEHMFVNTMNFFE